MNRNRLILLALVLAGFVFPAPAALAQAQPMPQRLDVTVKDADASLENDWFGIYFQNKKIGFFNNGRSKMTENGVTFYREKMLMIMKLQSFGQKTELKIEQIMDFQAQPPFRLTRVDFHHHDEKIKQRIQLALNGKKYDVTITTAGVKEKKTIEVDYTMADSLTSEVWLKKTPKKGDSITTREFDPEELKIHLNTTKLIETKEAMHRGVKLIFHEIESFSHKSNTTMVSLYDSKGHLLSGSIAGVFEFRREKEEEAKNTEFSADLFILGLAKIDAPIGETRKVSSLIVEVKGKEMAGLPDGPNQTLVAKGGDVFHLKIGKEHGKKIKAPEKEVKEGLEETTSYPIMDAKVKTLAAKAIEGAKTDQEKVTRLCKFVYDFIEPSLEGTMPKIHDLIERKCGDCKAYALLFTTLARANGLAAREVSGFVYMGDAVKAFGGHAWNEVLVDGYWLPIDASMNSTEIDAAHVCLGVDRDSTNNMLKTFGKLQFKLIEVKTAK
jgi:hypothetical protein